ncbi:MAG: hypothetical protein KDK53_21805 [Maritimibacter sp.]|nr:hypothetical protein [Maritimibacter sp.]
MEKADRFNILIVGQAGRLQYEALLFAASLRLCDPGFSGRLIVAEPAPGGAWPGDPRIADAPRAALADLGAEIVPFPAVHFGADYPQGNKIEALTVLPAGEPFVFFDSDTVVTGPLSALPFAFDRPAASMRREGTWPVIELYGPGYAQIWKALYDRFDLDFESSLDRSQPDEYWERYLYFNAGWFYGADPARFGEMFLRTALSIRDDPPPELALQPLDPWLDQVALPLVVHALGGGRPGPELDGLDGDVTCHWRVLPLAYARESDRAIEVIEAAAAPNRIKKVLKQYEPMRRMIFQGRGRKLRDLFDRDNLPRREKALRNQIKRAGYWTR